MKVAGLISFEDGNFLGSISPFKSSFTFVPPISIANTLLVSRSSVVTCFFGSSSLLVSAFDTAFERDFAGFVAVLVPDFGASERAATGFDFDFELTFLTRFRRSLGIFLRHVGLSLPSENSQD